MTLVLKSGKQNCFCFPETQVLLKAYQDHLNDRYMSEKTSRCISSWLSNKNKKDYWLVPYYAVSEFERRACKNGESPECTMAKIHSDDNRRKIKRVLQKIARPCPCDK